MSYPSIQKTIRGSGLRTQVAERNRRSLRSGRDDKFVWDAKFCSQDKIVVSTGAEPDLDKFGCGVRKRQGADGGRPRLADKLRL
jgi:hypothetical protein